ncbi:MAG: hypothetical protein EOM19_07020 [Candidatus Moranbacteria bacterium]|nr:hypothetical protein [Candidatus Moranbacteria bacterium]
MSIAYKGTLPIIIHFSALQGSVYATKNVSLSKRDLFYSKLGFFAEFFTNEPYLIRYQDSNSDVYYVLPPKELECSRKDREVYLPSYIFLREDHQNFDDYIEYILSQKLIPFES